MINTKWLQPLRSTLHVFLILILFLLIPAKGDVYGENAKYIILMISDGWGAKHIEATNKYTGTIPLYQSDPNWTRHWMSTFPDGGSYNTAQAWSDFNYVMNGYGDSSACGTALYTGLKTANGRVTVSADASTAFFSIGERAKELGMTVGAVSTVPVSHATPGAWMAHNDDRGNTFAIADEGLFGDPNTTGTIATDIKYGGGHGPTMPPADVVIGTGGSGYVSSQILAKLRNENSQPGKHVLVERQTGADGGDALMIKANDPAVTKLAGLFDHIYHNANDSGYNAENPTLSESTLAALKVLGRNPNGFVLMIEGGAIDWASHANNMNQMIGEQKDYDNAVRTVINWVDDPANDSNWNNTLVIVTGDHECGYLTKASGAFPSQSLGVVNDTTLAKEKIVSGTGGRRASWEDIDSDNIIDAGETVYWQWNSGGHSNSLIPLYIRGAGADLLAGYATKGPDSERGYYLDNTDVFMVMNSVISGQSCTETGSVSITTGQTLYGNPINLSSIVTADNAVNLVYTVRESGSSCSVDPRGTYVEAENFTETISQGTGTFVLRTNQTGYLGTGYLQSNGGSFTASCPSADEGKGYNVYFPAAGTYTVWIRGYAISKNDDSLFIGMDGICTGALRETPPGCTDGMGGTCEPYLNNWTWTSIVQNGSNSITVPTPGLHSINVWVREPDHRVDGIYITQGTEIPTDASHGVTMDPMSCNTTLFSGNQIQAQSVNTAGWANSAKNLKVTGDDAVCLIPLLPAQGTFTFDSAPSTAGITVTPTSGLTTTEAGGTAAFTVKLNTQPTANVTIAISSSDTTEGTIAPTSLTFTSANWNTAQTVTVTGKNDYVVDGNIAYTIVTAAASSTDTNYNGINAPDVSLTNNDNDVAGITVTPTSGLVTTESGGKAFFKVKLNTQPTANVTIALSSSDTTEGKVSSSSLRFTATNWNIEQKVTVTGINDFIVDGNQPYTILTHPAVSADSNYNGLNAPNVSVTNNDNDKYKNRSLYIDKYKD